MDYFHFGVSTPNRTVAGIIVMLWGCIVYLPVLFISELNFLFLMSVSFVSPQGLDV
uniref:Uncharacterized protein n=1 Tax=Panthera tigris altaica TaxID=74533 RepID=A0A8C9JMX4_PANTA